MFNAGTKAVDNQELRAPISESLEVDILTLDGQDRGISTLDPQENNTGTR
jgi:hypothetical protein